MKIFGIIFAMLLLVLTITVVAQEEAVNETIEEPIINISTETNITEEPIIDEILDETEVEELEKEAGITPDSFFYGLDKAFEKISLALTFDKAKKAEKRLKIASERIAELRVMIKKGKPKFAEKLVKEHNEKIEEAEKDIEKAKVAGKNVTLLKEHVAEMTYKHITVLQKVLEKVPEQAKPAIEKAINKSIKAKETEETVEEEVEEETEEVEETEESQTE